jgi:hypothetical protein
MALAVSYGSMLLYAFVVRADGIRLLVGGCTAGDEDGGTQSDTESGEERERGGH